MTLKHEPVNKFLKCKCGNTDIQTMGFRCTVIQTTQLIAYSRHGNIVWDPENMDISGGDDGTITCGVCGSDIEDADGGGYTMVDYDSCGRCDVVDGVVTKCADYEHKWED